MRDNNVSSNPIGVVDDFNHLFAEIRDRVVSSSDNWFQQYRVKPTPNSLDILYENEYASDNIHFSNMVCSPSSTKKEILPLSNEQFTEKYKDLLLHVMITSSIYKGEDNDMSVVFSEMFIENKTASLNMLNELYINNIQNEFLCVKILSLCNDYSEKELFPTAQILAALSINHKSDRVKSAAMNLFSHWGTIEAYKLLCSITCPDVPWIKMKYVTIKKALERRWCL